MDRIAIYITWAGLAYEGSRATFWLYGGDISLEAYAPFSHMVFTRRDTDDGWLTPHWPTHLRCDATSMHRA
jgi:hypothetical protein